MRAMVQKSFLLVVMLICGSAFHLAAQINVTGVVFDEWGESIPGVNIIVKGETRGAVTDFDGKFGIAVPNAETILTFSFIGYEKQDVKIGKQRELTVNLVPESKNLDEVVVIGYAEVSRKDLTGAVAKANMSDMLKSPVVSFDQALGGRIAGVQVSSSEGTPGSGFNIVIRGNNSITQDNSPLYVIDGFPVEDANAAAINPADIESLDILKDASATAIYGARGANGVVIITTKKGKVGKPVVSYNGSIGFSHATNTVDLLTPVQFIELQKELSTESEFAKKYMIDSSLQNGSVSIQDFYAKKRSWDWQDEVLRTAITNNHHLSLAGGTADTRYAASMSYLNQEGVIINSDYNRYQGRFNLDQRLSPKLKLNINANYAHGVTNGASPSTNESSATNNLMYSVWGYRPVAGDDTDLSTSLRDEGIDTANDYRFNPILSAKEEYRRMIQNDLQANAFLEYSILKELKLKVSGGYRLRKRENEIFNNSKTRYGASFGSIGSVNGSLREYDDNRWLNENLLTYNKIFDKKHNVNAQFGASFEHANTKYYRVDVKEIANENMGMAGLGAGTPYLTEASISESSQMSYFTRLNYNFKSKYYVTASFRADGSSRFPKEGRWGYFPSGSLAWAFSRENFMESVSDWMSNGKLRLSWGRTGNNRVADFASLAKIASNANDEYSFGDAYQPGFAITSLANNDLKWETTEQTNFGVDLGFFDERITFTGEVYHKITRDLLLHADLPAHAGVEKAFMNIGKMRNQGLELSLETINIQNKNFQWTTSFNIAFNQSKVLELARNQNSLLQAVRWDNKYNTSPAYVAQVGKPLGTMFGYIYEGTYKYDDFNTDANGNYTLRPEVPNNGMDRNSIQPGDVKYKDLNKDGTINDKDRTIIGNGAPIHVGGFSNNFTYKGFDLNIFFTWSYGNDILNANRLIFEGGQRRKDLNMYAAYANRWTPENPNSDIPRVGGQGPEGVYSTRVIEDGSYLRLKNVTLGYTFPAQWCKKLTISNARLFVSGENLLTFTSYSGFDPEVSVRNSALTPGFDYSAYPRARNISCGLSVTF